MVFPTDWSVNRENASPITFVVIESSSPIVGIGSLRTRIFNASPITERLTIQNNTYSNGLLAGRIRSVIRIDTLVTDGVEHVGFLCMQNSVTAYGGSDSAYGVTVSAGNGVSSPDVNIVKYNTGFPSSPLLMDISSTTVTAGSSFVLQMDWVSSFSLLGGTLIRGYIGVATTDFGNLVQVVEATDIGSPFLTSVAEGFIQSCHSGVAPDFDVKWDETSIYELV